MDDKLNSPRLTDYLQAFWELAKGDRRFPALGDVIVNDLHPKHKKDIVVLELLNDNDNLSVNAKYIGEGLLAEYPDESELQNYLESNMELYDKVIQSRREVVQNIVVPQAGGKTLKYRQILLPLGPDDDKPINGIICGMRYKIEE